MLASYGFQSLYMMVAMNITDGHSQACCDRLPKETQVMPY